jgi:hypothetical protein
MIGLLLVLLKGISKRNMSSPIFAPVFLLVIVVIVILSTSIEESGITIVENHSVYASPSSTATLSDFNFAAAGDWDCTSDTTDTVNNILDKKPELVLGLGDFSYRNTTGCWLQMVDPIDEKMKISIGNHEDEYNDKASLALLNQYMSHFNLTKQYYSFDYQNVHFIAMSTELPWNKSSEQYKFVKDDLAKASIDPNIDWIVVYFHKQMYTSPSDNDDYPTLRNTYHPLFYQHGVDLVLQAHNHNYQRTYPIKFNSASSSNPIETSTNKTTYVDPDGQIFATAGTAGRYLFPFTGKEDYIVKQYLGFGILNVDIINDGKTLTGKFYANKNEKIIDQFTIIK